MKGPLQHLNPVIVTLVAALIVCLGTGWNASKVSLRQIEVQSLLDLERFSAVEISQAHLWLEEYLDGDKTVDPSLQVLRKLQRAAANLKHIAAHPLLSSEGAAGGSLSATSSAREAARCCAQLISLAGMRLKAAARTGTAADQEFDQEFDDLNHNLTALNMAIRAELSELNEQTRYSVYGSVAVNALLLIGLAFFIARTRDATVAHARELEQSVEQRTRQLRATSDQLRAVSDSVSDAIVISDTEGRIMDMNRAALAMFGHELAAVRGQPVDIIVPERLRAAHESSMTRARESGTMSLAGKRVMVPALNKDGREFPVEIALSRWEAPGERGFTAVLRDMTEAQATAAKLKANQEEIEHLVQTLRAANAQLLQAARHTDAFMAAMSHELRTPLTVILSYTQLLLDGVHGNIAERQRQSLETITQSGQGLLLLISEILDLAKIESGKLTLNMDTIRITILGRTCVDMLQPLAKSKQIRLLADIAPGLPSLRGDPQRLNQILVNLLGNAIKFTPAGGTVTLTAAPTPDFLSVQFTVADTGIGIAPENMSRLFQPFVQIDSKLARSYSGTGLGLAMVAKLAELHGGTASAESELGVGSKFCVTLPFNGPPAPAEEAHPRKV